MYVYCTKNYVYKGVMYVHCTKNYIYKAVMYVHCSNNYVYSCDVCTLYKEEYFKGDLKDDSL